MRAAAVAVLLSLLLLPGSAFARHAKVHAKSHHRGKTTVHSYTRRKPHRVKHHRTAKAW